MQITLNQDEITDAVEAYVRTQIAVASNQSIAIDFTNGRSPNGLSATLDIRSSTAVKAPAKPVTRTTAPVTEEISSPEPKASPKPKAVAKAEPEGEETKDEAPAAPKASPFKKAVVEDNEPEAVVTETDDDEAPAKAPGGSIFSKAS
jgi:hypothetical protein